MVAAQKYSLFVLLGYEPRVLEDGIDKDGIQNGLRQGRLWAAGGCFSAGGFRPGVVLLLVATCSRATGSGKGDGDDYVTELPRSRGCLGRCSAGSGSESFAPPATPRPIETLLQVFPSDWRAQRELPDLELPVGAILGSYPRLPRSERIPVLSRVHGGQKVKQKT